MPRATDEENPRNVTARIVVTWALACVIASLLGGAASAQEGFGGARNNGLVRDQVRAGWVPRPEAFTVAGFLGEHHFPVREERCEGRFCVFAAMGHGRDRLRGDRSAYLLVEPISGFGEETFERPALDLSVVIDRSGSMSGWKLDAALEAARTLLGKLGDDDRIALVTFDDQPRLELPLTADRDAARAALDRIATGGSTNIHGGLEMGFAELRRRREGALRRVVLLTDERPNVGNTTRDGFLELIGRHASGGVDLSVIGVGLDLGAELAHHMSQLEGGSYHYLEGPEGAAALFEDLRRMVVPVATRLRFTVRPGRGLRVREVFGVAPERVVLHEDGSATFRASTVFWDSARSGAVVRLEETEAGAALNASATIDFAYVLPESARQVRGETPASHRATRPDAIAEFESPAHYRAYALVSFAALMEEALRRWHAGDHARGSATMARARAALDVDARILQDPQLAEERALADRILGEMRRDRRAK